jgi:hypothetical protein
MFKNTIITTRLLNPYLISLKPGQRLAWWARVLLRFGFAVALIICIVPAQANELPNNLSGIIGSLFGQSWKAQQQGKGYWRTEPPKESFHQKTPPLFDTRPPVDLTPWAVKPKPRLMPPPLPHKKGERYA